MSLLVDTTAIVDVIRQHVPTMTWLAGHSMDSLYVSSITVGELYVGVYRHSWPDVAALESGLESLRVNTLGPFAGRVLSFDERAAEIWGRLKGLAAAKGGTLPDDDTKIAAIALSRGWRVVTSNVRHFDHVVDLVDPRTGEHHGPGKRS